MAASERSLFRPLVDTTEEFDEFHHFLRASAMVFESELKRTGIIPLHYSPHFLLHPHIRVILMSRGVVEVFLQHVKPLVLH